MSKIKAIAFYLPQFHAIPENDEWWGNGFTEWRNVKRGKPVFDGHYQQRIPTELGYYDLVQDKSIQKKQMELAKKYDIYGFCYYYYWFNGKRLLEKPLNQVLENEDLDLPFCICWANENWTRRWDGLDKEILISQSHSIDSDMRFIDEVIPILKDKRYIKLEDAPMLLVYRVNLLPNPFKTIENWRERCKEAGIESIHICAVQSIGITDPRVFGCDSAVEFPPSGFWRFLKPKRYVENLDPNFKGYLYDYNDIVEIALRKKRVNYSLYRGAMLGFDNVARKLNSGVIFHNFTIESYKKWLLGCIAYEKHYQPKEKQILFINSWNEWGEGTYLEPDEKFGLQYLEATKEVMDLSIE